LDSAGRCDRHDLVGQRRGRVEWHERPRLRDGHERRIGERLLEPLAELRGEGVIGRAPLCLHHILGLIERLLELGMDGGTFSRQPVRPLGHILIAAADEAALYIVSSDDKAAAKAEMRALVGRLMDAL
jgi:hypothetical protein